MNGMNVLGLGATCIRDSEARPAAHSSPWIARPASQHRHSDELVYSFRLGLGSRPPVQFIRSARQGQGRGAPIQRETVAVRRAVTRHLTLVLHVLHGLPEGEGQDGRHPHRLLDRTARHRSPLVWRSCGGRWAFP
jgi:hypothetical protein